MRPVHGTTKIAPQAWILKGLFGTHFSDHTTSQGERHFKTRKGILGLRRHTRRKPPAPLGRGVAVCGRLVVVTSLCFVAADVGKADRR